MPGGPGRRGRGIGPRPDAAVVPCGRATSLAVALARLLRIVEAIKDVQIRSGLAPERLEHSEQMVQAAVGTGRVDEAAGNPWNLRTKSRWVDAVADHFNLFGRHTMIVREELFMPRTQADDDR